MDTPSGARQYFEKRFAEFQPEEEIQSMLKNINMNAMVTFTLTEEGEKAINLPKHMKTTHGTITTELWDFVNLFGGKFYMGQKALLVKNSLQIDTKELTNE